MMANRVDPSEAAVLAFGTLHAGSAIHVIAVHSELAGTRIEGSFMRFTSSDSIWMRLSWCMGLEYGCA